VNRDQDALRRHDNDRHTRGRIVGLIDALSGDELRIVELQARRLVAGRREYGTLKLDGDPRDFIVEAIEEMVDGAQYLAAKLVQLQRNANLTHTDRAAAPDTEQENEHEHEHEHDAATKEQ